MRKSDEKKIYTVEREFKGDYTSEDAIKSIVRRHIMKYLQDENTASLLNQESMYDK